MKLYYFYTLKALWDGQGKIKMYYGMFRVKKQLSGKRPISPKKYWSILHSFLNKRKIPKIPPIRHNNTFLTDTLVKANTFSSFFAKQYSLIGADSELPAEYLLTHHRLELVNLDAAKLLSIIHAFDVSKVHGWDDVSVRMVKICDEFLVKFLLKPLFSLDTGNFPSN